MTKGLSRKSARIRRSSLPEFKEGKVSHSELWRAFLDAEIGKRTSRRSSSFFWTAPKGLRVNRVTEFDP